MKKTLTFFALLLLMGCSDTFVCEKINDNIWYNDKCYTKSDYDELKRQEEHEAEEAAEAERAQQEEKERAQREEEAERLEAELAAERDTIKTLEFYGSSVFLKPDDPYYTLPGFYYDPNQQSTLEIRFATSIPLQVDKNCFIYKKSDYDGSYYYIDDSDECILARRNHKSKIQFFNFKKYLPAKSVIKTEDEFLYVFNLYENIIHIRYDVMTRFGFNKSDSKYYKRSCYLNTPLTTAEAEKCRAEDLQFIRNVVLGKVQKCSKKYPNLYKRKSLAKENLMYFGLINLCKPDVSVEYDKQCSWDPDYYSCIWDSINEP